jgi:hypothetical protein
MIAAEVQRGNNMTAMCTRHIVIGWNLAGCIFLLTALLGCAGTTGIKEKPAEAPIVGQVGSILLVQDTNTAGGDKVLVATYLFRAGQVQPREAIVTFGSGKVPRSEAGDFRLQLMDRQGKVSAEYGIWNPRKVVVEKQGLAEVPEAIYSARFPFNAHAWEIRVLDPQGNVVARTDIGSVIREFCSKLREDKDCKLYNERTR